MTRVDFYVLKDQDIGAMHRFACRLALKALRSGQRVHVHTGSAKDSNAFDELLWDYPEQRFVPHALASQDPASANASQNVPITIGHNLPTDRDEFLINLAAEIPGFFARFDRVAEIIVSSTKKSGRDRYKHYRDRGYPLHHHDLDDWEV